MVIAESAWALGDPNDRPGAATGAPDGDDATGTLIVDEAPFATDPTVAVEVEFPEMFTSRAHLQRFVLSNEEVAQMLASSDYGAMTVRVSGPLNPTVWDTAG